MVPAFIKDEIRRRAADANLSMSAYVRYVLEFVHDPIGYSGPTSISSALSVPLDSEDKLVLKTLVGDALMGRVVGALYTLTAKALLDELQSAFAEDPFKALDLLLDLSSQVPGGVLSAPLQDALKKRP